MANLNAETTENAAVLDARRYLMQVYLFTFTMVSMSLAGPFNIMNNEDMCFDSWGNWSYVWLYI